MTLETFETYMNRLYAAFGKSPNQNQMSEYYDSFRDTDDQVFLSAFDAIKNECERWPTIAMMKSKISQAQRNLFGAGKPHFNEQKWQEAHDGAGCSCSMGLIFTHRVVEGRKYSYAYRCPVCHSYDAPAVPTNVVVGKEL